jgi:hypothetical protein
MTALEKLDRRLRVVYCLSQHTSVGYYELHDKQDDDSESTYLIEKLDVDVQLHLQLLYFCNMG